MVLLAIVVGVFGFFITGRFNLGSPVLPGTALAVAMAIVLVSFVLMIVRRDVASQAIGFFALENGVSLASLVVAAGLPLILEVAFLFDLLVAVVVFGVLIRVHHEQAESLSTATSPSCGGDHDVGRAGPDRWCCRCSRRSSRWCAARGRRRPRPCRRRRRGLPRAGAGVGPRGHRRTGRGRAACARTRCRWCSCWRPRSCTRRAAVYAVGYLRGRARRTEARLAALRAPVLGRG